MNNCQSLPGLLNVWYLATSNLPADVIYRAVAGIPFQIPVQPISINLKGEAVCEVEESYDNNCQMEKAKLTFITLDEVPTRQNLAFVIRTADGDMFTIGAKERPYPTVKVTRSTGSPDGDAAARKYEVSFTGRKALAPMKW
ncbi:MAG: hypothetical protein IJ551_09145 [Prevotella sp.]|nr:hypothetical protein [Prevotella sp.]